MVAVRENDIKGEALNSNVKVIVRIRPLIAREQLSGATEAIHSINNEIYTAPISNSINSNNSGIGSNNANIGSSFPFDRGNSANGKSFIFDQCYSSAIDQETLFEEIIEPLLLEQFMKGYNCTILAYGQTGSGKTFTMGTDCTMTSGIIPLSIKRIFELIHDSQSKEKITNTFSNFNNGNLPSSISNENDDHEIRVSFLELYNEELVDLLNPQPDRQKRAVLAIREDAMGGIFITGLKEEPVKKYDQVMSLLEKGSLCRTTKSTEMNSVSSRSHAIFTIQLRQKQRQKEKQNHVSNEARGEQEKDGNDEKWINSKIHFVDLAGSERLKRTNAIGIQVKESISINSGLLALGNVISALGEESNNKEDEREKSKGAMRLTRETGGIGLGGGIQKNRNIHIPYRDSKLTRLLQDALGGNCHTLMIACISPSSDDLNETINTLKYAYRARSIQNRAKLNISEGNGNEASLEWENLQLKREISQLKRELLLAKSIPRRIINNNINMTDNVIPNTKTNIMNSGNNIKDLSRIERESRSSASLMMENGEIVNGANFSKSLIKNGINGVGVGVMGMGMGENNSSKIFSIKFPSSPDGHFIQSQVSHGQNHHDQVYNYPTWLQESKAILEQSRAQLAEKIIKSSIMNNEKNDITNGENNENENNINSHPLSSANFNIPIKEDFSLQEELISRFEQCQSEYITMKVKYEARLKLMQDNFVIIQKERDLAIKANSSNKTLENQNSRIGRERYEDKIKQLGRQVNEFKNKLAEVSRNSTTRSMAMEQTIKNLRVNLGNIQSEKQKLTFKQENENKMVSRKQMELDNEITNLRTKERTSRQVAERQKRSLEFQTKVMQKQNQKIELLRMKLKQLVLNNRKVRIGQASDSSIMMNLNSPSWRVAFLDEKKSPFTINQSDYQYSNSHSNYSNSNSHFHESQLQEERIESEENNFSITFFSKNQSKPSNIENIHDCDENDNENNNDNDKSMDTNLSIISTPTNSSFHDHFIHDSNKDEYSTLINSKRKEMEIEAMKMVATTPPISFLARKLSSSTPIMSSHKSFFTRLADKATHSLRIPKSPSKTRLPTIM